MSKEQLEADRIIEMYSPLAKTWDCYDDCPNDDNNEVRCAIIHVEGIIEVITDIDRRYYTDSYALDRIDYWRTVLTILNNK